MTLSLAPISLSEWDRIVSQSDQALLFHTSAWLNLLTEVYSSSWYPLGIWVDGLLAGCFPLQLRQLGPFQLAGSPLMQVIASTPFLGPVMPLELLPAFSLGLEEYLNDTRVAHLEIAFPVEVDTLPFLSLGYTSETCETVILSMAGRTRAELWNGLSSSCRRAIRKAEASSLCIVEPQNDDFLLTYYRLCRQVYHSSRRSPHLDFDFYTALWKHLSSCGYLKTLLAILDGVIVAGALFLVYGDTAYYLSGASDSAALPYRPNNLLQWRFIEWALVQGCQSYDLGGAVVPGITRFKLSFGGSCQPFSRIYRGRSRLAQLGRAVYKKTIPWWRYVNR